MKGVVFLGDRKLELREFPDPTPGPRDVILEIKASGMCGTDLHTYRAPAQPGGAMAGGIKRQAGVIAGHEPCGVVAAVGAGVSEKEARVGERVMDHHYDGCGTCKHCRAGWTQMCLEGSVVYGSGGHGGHARYMKVPVSTLVPLPDALSFVTGAAISCGTGTAWGALRRLNLQGGETIAIFGQGPVGLSATQFAVVMGARVIACASSDDKLAFARQRGADETVNYDREDLRGALKKLGGERGIDVVYDPVGGRYAEPALRSLGWLGRYLVIGFAAGEIPKIPLNLALLKSCDIRGVAWGAWTGREPLKQRGLMADILKWTAEGKLSAHVQAVYPLSEIAAALEVLAARKAMGKIVLRV